MDSLPQSPDFAAFKIGAASVLAHEGLAVARLDCLNPIAALAHFRNDAPETGASTSDGDASESDARMAWLRATGFEGPMAEGAVLISGVREGLRAIFTGALDEHGVDGVSFALPEDVYPRYAQVLRAACGPHRLPGLRTRLFRTLPRRRLFPLEWVPGEQAPAVPGPPACLEITVLPLPLHPTGRWPTSREIASLRELALPAAPTRLGDPAPARLLLLDCVYTYDYAQSRAALESLLVPPQGATTPAHPSPGSSTQSGCVALFSLSKGWLAPGVDSVAATAARSASSSVGWALSSPPVAATIAKWYRASGHRPSSKALAAATPIVSAAPTLPQQLNRRFAEQWRKLAPSIRAHGDPTWVAPATGYLGVLRGSWKTHLRAGAGSGGSGDDGAAPLRLLTVPASVFGSAAEQSVVSCLYDIAADDKTAAAHTFFYVTTLSNFGLAFDAYARAYDKARLPHTSFPDRVFVLRSDELAGGIAKAARLLSSHGVAGDSLVALQARLSPEMLQGLEPAASGVGRSYAGTQLPIEHVFPLGSEPTVVAAAAARIADEARRGAGGGDTAWAWTVEDAMARALRLLTPRLAPYDALRPLTVSVLPSEWASSAQRLASPMAIPLCTPLCPLAVAHGCQARCAFCFSEASVSVEQRAAAPPLSDARVLQVLRAGRAAGAVRAVITGGGEPSMLPPERLEALVRMCVSELPKVVLISNGYVWGAGLGGGGGSAASEPLPARVAALRRLREAGLSVLALSRHGPDARSNARIMALETGSDLLPPAAAAAGLALRWVCVLQRGGVEDAASLRAYIDWAAGTGVRELCFKELYVSSSEASRYFSRASNAWAREMQVRVERGRGTFS